MAKSRERTPISARQRVAEHKSGFDLSSLNLPEGASLWKPKTAGVYRIDVIPYKVTVANANPHAKSKGSEYFERTYFLHRGIGANGDSYVCNRKTANKPCAVCDYRAKLGSNGGSEEEIAALAPKERQLFNIIDLKEPDKGIQLFEMSFHLFGKLLDSMIENQEDGDDYDLFADIEQGKTLKLNVEEKVAGKYKFMSVEGIEFKDRKVAYDESILDDAFDLDKIPKIMDYEVLKAILLQAPSADEDADSDDEDEKPAKKTTSKKKPAKEEVEDTDEEDDTPLPTKKGKKGFTPAVDDEDEDTEDEDSEVEEDEEDEPEPVPAKKSKTGTAASKPGKIEVGSTVTFDNKGKTYQGILKSINYKNDKALVKIDQKDIPVAITISKSNLQEDHSGFDVPRKGETVDFTWKGKEYTGKVIKVNAEEEIASIQVEGKANAFLVPFDEIATSEAVEEEDEEIEEEEETPPPKKPAKKTKTPPPDEEEEDTDDDEDDLPPSPKKKAKSNF